MMPPPSPQPRESGRKGEEKKEPTSEHRDIIRNDTYLFDVLTGAPNLADVHYLWHE